MNSKIFLRIKIKNIAFPAIFRTFSMIFEDFGHRDLPKIRFQKLEFGNDKILWGQMSKPFYGQAAICLADEIEKLKLTQIEIIQSFASQMESVAPGLYKVVSKNYKKTDVANFPSHFSAQGWFFFLRHFKLKVNFLKQNQLP